jgi:holo-[acyl-carrier protein] synthase
MGGFGKLEIGIDCVDISKFTEDIVSKENILKRIFTENEIRHCEKKMKPPQHYAVRFAAKEAIVKAFSCYGFEISLGNIEILNKENRVPYVNILDNNLREYEIKISLSHTENIAVACAYVYKSSTTQ